MSGTNEFFPDRIYAVGGAGIDLLVTMLKNEWIHEAILHPRPQQPEDVTVKLIETAENNENDLDTQVTEIRQLRNEVRDRVEDPTVGPVGSLTVEYELLTDDIHITEAGDLVGPAEATNIREAHGLDYWWPKESDVDENLDLSQGVYRRRGLAKAIYYKATAQDPSLNTTFDMPGSGRVAICVGLGGGTGGGTALDIAKTIKWKKSPTSDVTLFGVLPSEYENDDVKTNAYTMLSELEHLACNEDRELFRDIVLMPIDATEYEGKTGDGLGTEDNLQEFDEAFGYVFISYYNHGQEKAFDQSPRYAPFTVAVPQVLRYNIAAIEDTRNTLEESVEHLEEGVDAGLTVHERVNTFLHGVDGVAEVDGLPSDYRNDLTRLFSQLEQFVHSYLFEELEYATVQKFDALNTEASAETDGIVEQLRHLEMTRAELGGTHEELTDDIEYVDDLDRRLGKAVQATLEFLHRRLEVLRNVAGLQDARLQNALYAILSIDKKAQLKRRRIEDAAQELRDDVEDLESTLSARQQNRKEQRSQLAAERERKLELWREETADERALLQSAADVDVTTTARQLSDRLQEYALTVERADSETDLDALDDRPVIDAVEALVEQFRALGLPDSDARDCVQKKAIRDSVRDLEKARTASLRANESLSPVFTLLPWETGAESERVEAANRLRSLDGSLNRNGVYTLGRTDAEDFEIDVCFDIDAIQSTADERIETLAESVVHELEVLVDGELPEASRQELMSLLKAGETVEELVAEQIHADIGGTDDIAAEIEELQNRLTEQRESLDTYERIVSLFEDTMDHKSGSRPVYENKWQQFRELAQTRQDVDSFEDSEYYYVRRFKPREPMLAAGESTLADTELLTDERERQYLTRALKKQLEQVLRPDYHGLKRRQLTDGTRRYDGMKINVGVLCSGVEEIKDLFDPVKDTMFRAFGLRNQTTDYGTWSIDKAGPWDIGMTLFVDGVFLDNIRNITDYRDSYEPDQLTHGIHMYHALGLGEGWCVRRSDLINVNDSDQLELYLRDDKVTQTLRDEYSDRVRFEQLRSDNSPAQEGDLPEVSD